MKKLILFLMILTSASLCAQTNLVNNPGFEQYTSCTNAYNQIWYCVGWTGVPGCPGITNVADYFNGCGSPGYAPPAVGPAWQIPHGGNAYIGITSANSLGNCREYAQALLLDTLIPGTKYNVSYYANLGGNAYFSLASNKLGALFTTYEIPSNVTLPALNFAHVYTDTVITDTVGWYHFSESFIADSAYKYMTIGNFFDAAHIITVSLQPSASYAWYLIDDVYVGEDSVTTPIINLMSTDTNFCEKHCIDFYDLSTNNPISWQWFFPGADSITSTLQNPTNICYNSYGSFDITLIACNLYGCDTLVLPGFINEYHQPAPTITQSNDTLYSSFGTSYQWWNVSTGIIAGATNNYYLLTTGGDYYVIVTDSIGCAGSSNVITISFAGINQFEVASSQTGIIPNPNDGSFNLEFNKHSIAGGKENFTINIIDAFGRNVFHSKINSEKAVDKTQINLNVANGIYYLQIKGYEILLREKFVVSK